MSLTLTAFSFLAGTLITEPPAGEHRENQERWSIPECRSCPRPVGEVAYSAYGVSCRLGTGPLGYRGAVCGSEYVVPQRSKETSRCCSSATIGPKNPRASEIEWRWETFVAWSSQRLGEAEGSLMLAHQQPGGTGLLRPAPRRRRPASPSPPCFGQPTCRNSARLHSPPRRLQRNHRMGTPPNREAA